MSRRLLYGLVSISLVLFALSIIPNFRSTSVKAGAVAPSAKTLSQNIPALPDYRLPAMALSTATFTHAAVTFPFKTYSVMNGYIIIHYYSQPVSFAQQVAQLVQNGLQNTIQVNLGLTLIKPVNIYVFNSQADFISGANVSNPAEVGAYTDPATSSIYVPIPELQDDLAQNYLTHEMTHIVFHQNEDGPTNFSSFFRFFPLWLDEGLATNDELGSSITYYTSELQSAIAAHNTPNLLTDFIFNYPTDVTTDDYAYAEARSFIHSLFTEYGAATMHTFIKNVKYGNINQVAMQTFGVDLQVLYTRWAIAQGIQTPQSGGVYWASAQTYQTFVLGTTPATASAATPQGSFSYNYLPIILWIILGSLLVLSVLAILINLLYRTLRPAKAADPAPAVPQNVYVPVTSAETPFAAGDLNSPNMQSDISPFDQTAPQSAVTAPYMAANSGYGANDFISPTAPVIAPKPNRVAVLEPLFLLVWGAAALGFGALITMLISTHAVWFGYFTATVLAVFFAIWEIVLMIRSRKAAAVKIIGRFLLVIAFAGVGVSAYVAGNTAVNQQFQSAIQAQQYQLAVTYAQTSWGSYFNSNQNLAMAYHDWSTAAAQNLDYPTAIAKLQLAAALDQGATRDADVKQLVTYVESLGKLYLDAGKFTDAQTLYSTELNWSYCSAYCITNMQNDLATALIGLGDQQLTQNNISAAENYYLQAKNQYSGTNQGTLATSAYNDLTSLAKISQIAQNNSTLTSQIASLTSAQSSITNNDALQEINSFSVPVTGSVSNSLGSNLTGHEIFFFGFTNRTSAEQFFTGSVTTDNTVERSAAFITAGGNFSTTLQAGLWYGIVWYDPALGARFPYNTVNSANNIFYATPLQANSFGHLQGF